MDELDERAAERRGDVTAPGERTLAGRYRLVRPLGSGGMGVVWEGRDLRLGRRVAVKMLAAGRPDAAHDPADTSRLIHEARVASLVSHPGVTAVFDVGIDGGRPFVVMELVEGPTLASILERGHLGTAEATRIGARLAEALAAIHGRGIVHGDVTPANVIIAPDGRPKLTDLGIASFPTDGGDGPDGAGGYDGRSARSERYGTLPYVAPEVLGGADPTSASDVFSLGVLLGELFASGGGACSAATAEVVERARAAEPSARPSAAAIASSLAATLPPSHDGETSEPVVVRDPPAPDGLANAAAPATVPLRPARTPPTTRLEPTGAPTTTKLRPIGAARTGRLEPVQATPSDELVTSVPGRMAPRRSRRPSVGAFVAAVVGPLVVGLIALAIIAAAGRGTPVQTPSPRPTPSVTAAASPTQTAIVPPPTHGPTPAKAKDHHQKRHGHGE
jgi:hypothetical protein